MPKISVIIPVYNVEPYLERCIDSVLSQTFSDFEIILVDDGSTDSSGKICDRYRQNDTRVTVIHQENAGVSAARNRGLDLAKGQYVVFVDSDDWVGEKYLMDLNDSAADFVGHSFSVVDTDGNLIKIHECSACSTTAKKAEIVELLKNGALEYMVAKRFSTEIIRKNNIRFAENISYAEDTMFIGDYLLHANTVQVDNKVNYFYVKYINRNTLSNNISIEKLAMVCVANSLICKAVLDPEGREYEELYYLRIGYNYMSYLNIAYLHPNLGPIKLYAAISSLLNNEDVKKIIKYCPDALWKLSLHPRIITACSSGNNSRLLGACFYSSLSNAIHKV